ncbi:MAG: HAMP domain-containing histidine kinase [Oscillospiraceae bacterium]|nr:HAMP domain-containing histidine kinase [Oscillospiraceae bacterium]
MKKNKRSHVARRAVMWYIILIIVYPVLIIVAANFVQLICVNISWDHESGIYRFLIFVRNHIELIGNIVILSGWLIITFVFLIRPLRYIDEIAEAAKKLAAPTDEEITLSKRLYEIEYELNSAREKALRSAEIAREAEKRKNDLIVYLAHDLKTPLTSVIGYLTLLRDEPQISEEFRTRYTGIALDKAERLEQLINEFFDITRFNLSTITLETERVSLSLMLEQTVSEFMPILAEKNLACAADIQPDIEILCDPDKLARVFDNLLRNAVNYSYPNSEIQLSMTAENGSAAITVTNRGRTIPKEKLDRIFEQFFRLDTSRSSASGGAGLGLAIAKEIVELHGGKITAESENESVRFTVVLPQN